MKNVIAHFALISWLALMGCHAAAAQTTPGTSLRLPSTELRDDKSVTRGALRVHNLFFETSLGRTSLPTETINVGNAGTSTNRTFTLSDGRKVNVAVAATDGAFEVSLSSEPAEGVVGWGFSIEAGRDEYFTGLMERTVDGPQQASWAPGIKPAMNLRGQKVDMLLKPTTSVYAPFYLSSRGYGLFVRTDWPGRYDFCVTDPRAVQVAFEGPALKFKVYTAKEPAALVQAHARDAGLPFLPPKWAFTPWRWRDEHRIRTNYYDGTPVNGPFNAEVMEDVLMMKAFGIPCGLYWIDRPYGPGRLGYDDFEIDPKRLPNFAKSIEWLAAQDTKMMLWIGPFYQGEMETNALKNGWNLAGQQPQRNNYPLVDFSNPAAKKYWQDGVAKLLKLGVAGFKLDRGEEQIPESGPFKIHDGRSIREQRNNYPVMYLQAAYEVAKEHRGNDFVCMPRAAYTGSSPHGVFWGGDVGGVNEGLRASIIAVQRSAVMGYPNWGSDTCGYGKATLEQELCIRWLAFSCFTPIMEVGPTKDVGFWNLPREPRYDASVIAAWRLYARLHQRLADYSHAHAVEAAQSGLPIVRPLFLVDPKAEAAWENWWTYQYGRDLVVSPMWRKGQRSQEVYLPAGNQWRDAWNSTKIYPGGKTIHVKVDLHQIPIFVRVGADLPLGDLNQEWSEALAVAAKRPDLKALEAEVIAWFEKNK
jgi:alpha-glucosidase (family GH31 glycosyl hydrolase)